MSLIDTVPYEKVEPQGLEPALFRHLRIYALSTCAFCEKSIDFLKQHRLPFEYIFVDNLETDTKRGLKTELKAKYGNIPVFPLLVIDHETPVSGFTEEKWKEILNLS